MTLANEDVSFCEGLACNRNTLNITMMLINSMLMMTEEEEEEEEGVTGGGCGVAALSCTCSNLPQHSVHTGERATGNTCAL